MEPNKLDAAINHLQQSIIVLENNVGSLASAVVELRAQQQAKDKWNGPDLNTKGAE